MSSDGPWDPRRAAAWTLAAPGPGPGRFIVGQFPSAVLQDCGAARGRGLRLSSREGRDIPGEAPGPRSGWVALSLQRHWEGWMWALWRERGRRPTASDVLAVCRARHVYFPRGGGRARGGRCEPGAAPPAPQVPSQSSSGSSETPIISICPPLPARYRPGVRFYAQFTRCRYLLAAAARFLCATSDSGSDTAAPGPAFRPVPWPPGRCAAAAVLQPRHVALGPGPSAPPSAPDSR